MLCRSNYVVLGPVRRLKFRLAPSLFPFPHFPQLIFTFW